jgi:hypothetical protein
MRPSEREPAAAERGAAGAAGVVEFVDGDHVRWHVCERDARRDPGALRKWCLVFSCDDAMRRVWDYAPGWRTLSAVELIALSWRR